MDPTGQLSELGQGGPGVIGSLIKAQGGRRIEVIAELRPGESEGQRQRHETLLGAVVKVALEALALCVAGGDDPCPRRPDLVQLHLDLGLQAGVLRGESLDLLVRRLLDSSSGTEPRR